MATAAGAEWSRGESRSWSDGKELLEEDAMSERELTRLLEVKLIKAYAIARAYILKSIKWVGSLALLWSTVVLLGGFVTLLNKLDFGLLTFIGFIQAAGLFNMLGDSTFFSVFNWMRSALWNMPPASQRKYCRAYLLLFLKKAVWLIIFVPVFTTMKIAVNGLIICFLLSLGRLLLKQDYGSDDGDASKANLKPALNIFYSLSLAQGAIYMLFTLIEHPDIGECIMYIASRRYKFTTKVFSGYFNETKLKCVNNLESFESWNLFTYGAGLLDSESPNDYVSGARALNMLIEKGIPIKRLLIGSPRHRIQKLIGALGWRSPADREARMLTARIVAHLASDLNVSEFPGALQCISSLLDGHHYGAQAEALTSPEIPRIIRIIIKVLNYLRDGRILDTKQREKESMPNTWIEINEDLLLQGLIILDMLAYEEHNCAEIFNKKDLLDNITGPLGSKKLIRNIELNNDAWTELVDASMRVVSRLMAAPGATGTDMRHKIEGNSDAIENLESVLELKPNRHNVVVLQMRAIEILTQLFQGDCTRLSMERREKFINRVLKIFLTDSWMKDFLEKERAKILDENLSLLVKDMKGPELWHKLLPSLYVEKHMKYWDALVEKRMKETQNTAIKYKEKAGEALAMLSAGSKNILAVISRFTECNVVGCLTTMLDSKIKTIRIEIGGETKTTIQMDIKMGCRISATEVLKNLCPDNPVSKLEMVLRKVFEELLHVNAASEPQSANLSVGHTSYPRGGDEENPTPRNNEQDEHSSPQNQKKQSNMRRLTASLLSLYAAICARWTETEGKDSFAAAVAQLIVHGDSVWKLKTIVEENSYATPACLAILKIICQMAILLIQHGDYVQDLKKKRMVDTLYEASETMARLESRMIFAGLDYDSYGVAVEPLSSALVKQVRDLLTENGPELVNNPPPAAAGPIVGLSVQSA